MTPGVLHIDGLPEAAISAARQFYFVGLPQIDARLEDGTLSALLVALAWAGHDHRDWRQAMARDLARHYAPVRINIVAGSNGPALAAVAAYLATAEGVTGQYWALS